MHRRRPKRGSPARRYELRLRAFRMVALLLAARPRGLQVRELMDEIGISRAGIYRMRQAAERAGLAIHCTSARGDQEPGRWQIVIAPVRRRRP